MDFFLNYLKNITSKFYGFLFGSLMDIQVGLSPDIEDIYFTVTLHESLTSIVKYNRCVEFATWFLHVPAGNAEKQISMSGVLPTARR